MGKSSLFIYLILFFTVSKFSFTKAQDTLIFKNGNVMAVKILKVFPNYIEYQFLDSLSKVVIKKPISAFNKLKFQNQQFEIINNEYLDSNTLKIKKIVDSIQRVRLFESTIVKYYSTKQLDSLGIVDSEQHYTTKYGTKTFLTTFFLTPVIGGFVALNYSGQEITTRSLNIPKSQYKDSAVYKASYLKTAKKTRNQDISAGFFPTLAFYFLLSLIVFTN